MLNVFNRNTIRKQRPGHLFVCRRKTEANAPASSQERTNAFYVIVSAIGVFRWSRYRIRPECIADLRYSVKLIEREGVRWSGRRDSNPRPSAPKADALPDCATPRRWLLGNPRLGILQLIRLYRRQEPSPAAAKCSQVRGKQDHDPQNHEHGNCKDTHQQQHDRAQECIVPPRMSVRLAK